MDSSMERIKEALKKAMQAENEGYHFYMMAALNIQDPKGKEVFQLLADDEKGHFQFLKDQYDAVEKTGKPDNTLSMGKWDKFSDSHPIFSQDIKNRVGSAHYEMTALSIGAQLEMSAVTFYKAEAKAASGAPVIKAFLEELAEWETEHLRALQAQLDMLKEDYWHDGGFSPF